MKKLFTYDDIDICINIYSYKKVYYANIQNDKEQHTIELHNESLEKLASMINYMCDKVVIKEGNLTRG